MIEKFNLSLDRLAKLNNISEIIFIGLVVLCFIADIIGEVSDHISIIYWLLMIPVFFLSSLVVERSLSIKLNKPSKNYLWFSIILWTSSMLSILLVFLLWHSGTFLTESVGLIVHIILAHTLFISGFVLGLRFYLLGFFLFIMAGLTIAMEGAVGITLMLSVPIILLGLYFKKIIFTTKNKLRLPAI